MEEIRIRNLGAADLDFAAALTAAEGWVTESRAEFAGFRERDPAGCLLAEWRGEPAGICVASAYGGGGFLGEMIIARSMRGHGLGPPLFARALAYLDERGCRAVSLDGVPRAVPFYESGGFRSICPSLRMVGRVAPAAAAGVRPMAAADLARVCAIDRAAFAGDRSFFLRQRFQQDPDLALLLVSGRRIAGYLFGRRRPPYAWAGPLWSDAGPEGARALLGAFAAAAGETDIMAGVLERNREALAMLLGLGLRPRPHPSQRMVRGDEDAAVGLAPELYLIGTAAKG